MHHKTFIVDDNIVITGSYNPTASGTEKNDENILIIYSDDVANEFVDEYDLIMARSS
jgi:phosphatidylserine/phosphatidylglycerophosphate/cardiolipin synthase-like enzyme